MGHNVAVAHDPSARCAGTSLSRIPRRGGTINQTSTSARSWNQLWAWTYFLILGDKARGEVS